MYDEAAARRIVALWFCPKSTSSSGLELGTPPARLYHKYGTGRRNLNILFARAKLQEVQMSLGDLFGRTGRSLAVGAAILGTIGLTTVPRPAHAIGTGAAVGIGLGGLALGTALGAAANPYHNPYYYPYSSYSSPSPYSSYSSPSPYSSYSSPAAYGSYSSPARAYTPAPAYDPSTSYYRSPNCGYSYSWRSYVC
jgi:hypothetical protein